MEEMRAGFPTENKQFAFRGKEFTDEDVANEASQQNDAK